MALKEEFETQGNYLFKYRGILPIALLALGFIVFIQTELQARREARTAWDKWDDLVCLAIGLFGLFIRAYTVGHTPKNTSGRNTEGQLADELNTTGIYSIVRHPLYVGNFFMWLGVTMLTENFWFICTFILLYWVYYERIMYAEEQFLSRKFGARYSEWASRTPAFIPDFRLWKKPALSFSIKKVLRQEKNSLFMLFLVIFLFEVVGEYAVNRVFSTEGILWTIALLVSTVIYLILKYLKYNTSLLSEPNR